MTRALLLIAIAACTPTTTNPVDSQTPGPLPPSRHAAGEVVDANVPLQQGGVIALAELRGKLVVLEVVDAAHRDAGVESDYAMLLAESAGKLEVVMVSIDADGWVGDVPPFVLGWDPQGALAARLRAANVPTVLLLDVDGRVTAQYAGARTPGHAELVAMLRRALAASARTQ